MWTRTHSKTVTNVQAEQLWNVWTDVNQWHTWQPDIERATLDGPFAVGNTFTLKPAGAPAVKIELVAEDIVNTMPQQTDQLLARAVHG